MSDFSVKVPHSVGEYSAKALIARFLEDLRHNPQLTVHNSGTRLEGNRGQFSCTAMGQNITGTIEINSDSVVVNGSASMLAVGRAEAMIGEQLTKLFDLQPWEPKLPLPYPRPRR